jgi:hypothetical protein
MIETMRSFAAEKTSFDQRLAAYQIHLGSSLENTQPGELYTRFSDLGTQLERLPSSSEIDFSRTASKTLERSYQIDFSVDRESGDIGQLGLWLKAKSFIYREHGLRLSELNATWRCDTGVILAVSAKQHDFAGFAIKVAMDQEERHRTSTCLIKEIEHRSIDEPTTSAYDVVVQSLVRRLGVLESSVTEAERALVLDINDVTTTA